MGGKRRATAKTGDKNISRVVSNKSSRKGTRSHDDDQMYNEVDRFHVQRDAEEFIDLDKGNESDSTDDGVTRQEDVFGEDDDDNSDESSSDSEKSSSSDERRRDNDASDDEEQEVSSDSESEIDINEELGDIRDWGRQKSSYYHGDTADLEIGQDQQDAIDEEKAAQDVQAARFEHMDDEDFVLSDDEEKEIETAERQSKSDREKFEKLSTSRDLSKLTRAERRKLIQSHHPELLPLLGHFGTMVQEWEAKTNVIVKALFESEEEGAAEAVGATRAGLDYLLTKSLIQTSTALNVVSYLLLKAEHAMKKLNEEDDDEDEAAINSHPVISKLQKLNTLMQKLETNVESKVRGLPDQMESLVKAVALMKEEGAETNANSDDDDDSSASDSDSNQQPEPSNDEDDKDDSSSADTGESPADRERARSVEEERNMAQKVLNEARFGFRPAEVESAKRPNKKRVRRAVPIDYGDEDVDDSRLQIAKRSLSTTINAIEQRSATKKRRAAKGVEVTDDNDDQSDEAVRRGIEMMEAELGKLSDEEDVPDGELDSDGDGNDFYQQIKRKAKAKKEVKKNMYKVAPKYPRIEEEIEGERAISKQILKNRGLVAHKNKLNRNPRVKKREQYRKALIRRKGKVREVRTDEGHKYGGEETGIKSRLSRSRRL